MKKDTQITEVKNEAAPMTPESLIAQAIEKGTPVETMEKLLELHREMKKDWAKGQFDRAMAKFQSEMPTIEKRKQGYNYKYADLTDIVEQTKEYLAKNGFSYSFDTDETEKGLVIYCIIKHVDGHSQQSKAFIDKETTTKMNSSQQSGSVMTYGKRYAFVNAFGLLTGDEDTDASTPRNEIKTPPVVREKTYAQEYKPTQPVNGNNGKVSEPQLAFIKKLILELKIKKPEWTELMESYNITDFHELTKDQADMMIKDLLSRKEKMSRHEVVAEPEEEINNDEVDEAISKL